MRPSDLLRTPQRWTKRTYARDSDGKRIAAFAPEATQWCVRGAIFKCCADFLTGLRMLRDVLPPKTNITHWNDDPTRTHDEVLKALKDAGL